MEPREGEILAQRHLSARIYKGIGGGLRLQLTMRQFGHSIGGPIFVNQREYYRPTYAGELRYTSNHEK